MKKPGIFLRLLPGRLDCSSVGPMLESYHDGEVAGRKKELIEKHVSSCKQCDERLKVLDFMGESVRVVSDALACKAPDLSNAVFMEATRRARMRNKSFIAPARPTWPAWKTKFAYTLVATAAAISLFLGGSAVTRAIHSSQIDDSDCIVESLEYASGNVTITTVEPENSTIIWLSDSDEDNSG